ncbi:MULTISPECIES: hypothetical protein [unclassified Haematobacter]|uniref:hypothetical protein n=1 Tax=unclassified Haematobacter TaxID=2640585 RepID=UPI0025BACD6D|nr:MULTISPECIES: hypothetical protein [unclassified Haematobacter]
MTGLVGELNVVRLLLDGSAGLVIAGLHGFFLALAARILGDPGPEYDGRLTVSPLVHVDIFALLGFVFAQLGWIRPMDIRTRDLRGGIFGGVAVVLIALAGTWIVGRGVMAARGMLVAVTPPDFLQTMNSWTYTFGRLSDRFALFNLLPVLSLTAAHVVRERLPAGLWGTGALLSAVTLLFALGLKIWVWR